VSGDWAFLIILLVGGFLALAWYFSPARRIKRELRATRRVALRELPESTRARVVGAARIIEGSLEAPLTGRACLYYVVTVEQHHSNGRSSYWKNIIREERGVSFLLDDGTGRAIVDPNAAKVALDVDGRGNSGTFDEPDEREAAFLARHGTSGQGWVFNKRLRYREAVIEVGETVAIVGEGVREPDPHAAPEAAYRGEQPTRVRMTSSARFPLLISDSPDTTR
jgi:E3 Ubiquitin ligase